MADAPKPKPYLTEPEKFGDVSRGNPKPHSLKGEAAEKARLTAETWRLEIVAEGGSKITTPRTIEAGNALDMPALLEMSKAHGVKFLKAMQCLNIPGPLGQGLWEGVPVREVLKLVGKWENVRRIFYHGFHNNDPKQIFQSSLSYVDVMEAPPWDIGPFLAYRLNGRPLIPQRGGPVRMLVPWSHGFKSVKWLHKITLTNDYKANDTYAGGNNDPESRLKTMARMGDFRGEFKVGNPIVIAGSAVVGLSGLRRVECWLRPIEAGAKQIEDDDPAWKTAEWKPAALEPAPEDWGGALPDGVMPKDVWGFDPATGRPKEWPMRWSLARWWAAFEGVKAGTYELRARTVDLNGKAQPEPRPHPRSGLNGIQVKTIKVE